MPICAAFNCSFKPDRMKIKGRTYHRFPFSRPEILKRWIINVRRKNWAPNRYSILCSSHFEEDCFYTYGRNTYLKQDAVPTIFDYPILSKKVTENRKQSPERIYTNYPLYEVNIPDDPEVDAKNVKKEHNYTINPVKLKHTSDGEKSWIKTKYQTMRRVKGKLRQAVSYQIVNREDPLTTEETVIEQETTAENSEIHKSDFSCLSNQECETNQRKKTKLKQVNSYLRATEDDTSITEEQADIIKRILNSIKQETATENPEILESDFGVLEDSLTFHSFEESDDSSESDLSQTSSSTRKCQKRKWDFSSEDTSFIKELLEQQNHLISQQMSALKTVVDLNKQLINAMTNS